MTGSLPTWAIPLIIFGWSFYVIPLILLVAGAALIFRNRYGASTMRTLGIILISLGALGVILDLANLWYASHCGPNCL
jgi:lipoprotein signal peptidase